VKKDEKKSKIYYFYIVKCQYLTIKNIRPGGLKGDEKNDQGNQYHDANLPPPGQNK
jgi:hypothetical protein